MAEWLKRDPVKLFREYLLKEGVAKEAELAALDQKAGQEVKEAEAWAADSPWPDPQEAFDGVWAD